MKRRTTFGPYRSAFFNPPFFITISLAFSMGIVASLALPLAGLGS